MTGKSLAIALWIALTGAPEQNPQAKCLRNCELSESGEAMIQNFEGYSPFVYKDAAGLDTIGFGHLLKPGEKFEQPMLPETAKRLLKKDAGFAVRAINRHVTVYVWPGQADALISFTYNLGEGNFSASTLLKRVNAERHKEVPPQFLRWNHAGGRVVRGLTLRREAESEMYRLSTKN